MRDPHQFTVGERTGGVWVITDEQPDYQALEEGWGNSVLGVHRASSTALVALREVHGTEGEDNDYWYYPVGDVNGIVYEYSVWDTRACRLAYVVSWHPIER